MTVQRVRAFGLALLLALTLVPPANGLVGVPDARAPLEPDVPQPPTGWGSGANPEPNTPYDHSHGFMWRTSPDDPWERRVYFDVRLLQDPSGDASTPITGTPSADYRLFAFLGIWTDCNGDDVIGDRLTGLLVYRTEASVNRQICPPNGPHVHDGDVREFLWIVPQGARAGPDEIESASVHVWADLASPLEPYAPQHELRPLPSGTLESTGGTARFVNGQTGGFVPIDPVPDEPNLAGAALLEQADREQDENAPSMASATSGSCNSPWPTLNVDPFAFSVPEVAALPTTRALGKEAAECADRPVHDFCRTCPWIHTHPTLQPSEDKLELEGDVGGLKRSVDLTLRFARSRAPASAPELDPTRGPASANCEVNVCRGWYSEAFRLATPHIYAGTAPGVRAPRATPFPNEFLTGYAYVGRYTGYFPSSTVGTYGSWACQHPDLGWECDNTKWPAEPVPGTVYRLLDVDPLRYAKAPLKGEPDRDADGLGDSWQKAWRIVEAASDVDLDGAPALDEFRWDTIPLPLLRDSRDTDEDGWADGAEIAYWDAHHDEGSFSIANAGGYAIKDPDAKLDTDQDRKWNQLDDDSDGDGILDGAEIHEYGTLPESRDSDCASPAARCDIQPGYGRPRLGEPGTGDGIPDNAEVAFWAQVLARPDGWRVDCDHDGILNIMDSDSDNDGLLDSEEGGATSPCDDDADDDGLKDGDEVKVYQTDPNHPDTDEDGMPDGWEAKNAFAPRDPSDAGGDRDMDGLVNVEEYRRHGDPNVKDTDRDTLEDGMEAYHSTRVDFWDTDEDGMPDGWEVKMDLNPGLNDADQDSDGDEWTDADTGDRYVHANLDEYLYARPPSWNEAVQGPWDGGTFPRDEDSDDDGVFDGPEVVAGTAARLGVPAQGDDPDDDGLPTHTEFRLHTRPSRPDSDGDGLCDGGRTGGCLAPRSGTFFGPGEALDYGSDANTRDTDGDGINDFDEAAALDPQATGKTPDTDRDGQEAIVDPDTDDDHLTDGQEQDLGTAPTNPDTDGDGLTDQEETAIDGATCLSPLAPDSDGDGATDGKEYDAFTDPCERDSDSDGIEDAEELTLLTDPWSRDTDRDEMDDFWETRHGLDPRRNDASENADQDAPIGGLTNLLEYRIGTAPDDTDTDDDGIPDYAEWLLGLDPLANDAQIDADGDGLPNLQEHTLGTRPSKADTDGDGLDDGWEAGTLDETMARLGILRSNPLVMDTDGDGLEDGTELIAWSRYDAEAWTLDHDHDAPPVGALGHNLRDADSDNDGLDDGQEMLVLGTDPRTPDSDNDSDADRDEIMLYGSDPDDPGSNRLSRRADNATDTDGDGLSDVAERQTYHTDPTDADTDDDMLDDGAERIAWGRDLNLDYDMDGTPSNLHDADSDQDGLLDGAEFASAGLNREHFATTSPRSADTDADGLIDSWEDHPTSANQVADLRTRQACLQRAALQPEIPYACLDEQGPYALGAFGLAYRPTTRAESPLGAGAHQAPEDQRAKPRPDRADADGDFLLDGEEQRHGTRWDQPDTDGDGLNDKLETTQGTDPNVMDSDHDGIRDDAEARRRPDGTWNPGAPNPLDADSDEDGLLDGSETGLAAGSTDPTLPDSDHDGLPDGLERGLTEPQRNGLGLQDTVPKPMTCKGIPIGSTYVPAPPGLGSETATLADYDEDGLLDGLEDFNANGHLDPGELDPRNPDTDGDGISDGVELRIWGRYTYCDILDKQGSTSNLASALQYRPQLPMATDPRGLDTDADGVIDGLDIDPRGIASLALEFQTYQQLQPIDVAWPGGGAYSPELYFNITVETAAGTIPLTLGTLPELPLKDSSSIGILSNIMDGTNVRAVGGVLVDTLLPVSGGMFRIPLPNDLSQFRLAESKGDVLNVDEVRFTIHFGDEDLMGQQATDIIDLDGTSKQSTDATFTFRIMASRQAYKAARVLDGSLDGAFWGNADDDARLNMVFHDPLNREFWQNAEKVLRGELVTPAGRGLSQGVAS